MEVNQLHVGTSIQVTAGSLGAAPGLPNLAHQSATQGSTVPGTIWADGGLHIGSPIFAPGETVVGFTRAPLVTNPKLQQTYQYLKLQVEDLFQHQLMLWLVIQVDLLALQ